MRGVEKTPAEYRALADRVEAGESGQGLDKAVMSALGWCLHPMDRWRDDSYQSDRGYTCMDCGADSWGNRSKNGWRQRFHDGVPAVTTSLDAVESLRAKMLPESQISVGSAARSNWTCREHSTRETGIAPTEPAARLSAILRALAAKMEMDDAGE